MPPLLGHKGLNVFTHPRKRVHRNMLTLATALFQSSMPLHHDRNMKNHAVHVGCYYYCLCVGRSAPRHWNHFFSPILSLQHQKSNIVSWKKTYKEELCCVILFSVPVNILHLPLL